MRYSRILLAFLLSIGTIPVYAADLWRPKAQPIFADKNGKPYANAKLCFYQASTTNPLTVYKDANGTIPWTQPIVLDSGGALSDPIYVPVQSGGFKEVLRSSSATDCDTGTVIYTADGIPAALDTSAFQTTYARPKLPVITKTANYTVTTSDLGKLIAANAGGGQFTITLPAAVSAGDGAVIAIKKTDTSDNAVIVAANGTETIDGVNSLSLGSPSESLYLIGDGANWHSLNRIVDGSVTFVKLDESVYNTSTTMAGASNTNLPTSLAIKTYVDNAVTAGVKWKDPVRAATTTNGTLATAYQNGSTVDGVLLATGDRILIKNQTTQTENGIYTVNASGPPTRATDADENTEIPGATVFVSQGTQNAGSQWTNTNTSVTIGTTNITFSLISQGSAIPPGMAECGVRATAPNGWVWASGKTIGSASSGATERANSDTLALYTELWNATTNTELPIQDSAGNPTTRGASASADFTANKRLPLPDLRGRVVAGNDTMDNTNASRLSGAIPLSSTTGASGGAQNVTIAQANLPAINLSGSGVTDVQGNHQHGLARVFTTATIGGGSNAIGDDNAGGDYHTSIAGAHAHNVSVTVPLGGSGTPLNIVQPTYIMNCFLKL